MDTSNIDSILDATLDDLNDLPEFGVFPPGAHRVRLSMGLKEINKKVCVELSLVLINTEEYVDENTAAKTKEGDTCSTMFDLTNEYGAGNFKKVAAPLREALGPQLTNRELIENCKDVECIVITSLRTDKKDPDKKYLDIKQLVVL